MIKKKTKNDVRKIRHERVRSKIDGTSEVTRLCVFRSNTNIYAQIIDDSKGVTLVSVSSISPQLKGEIANGGNVEAAKVVGNAIGKLALENGIEKVVFDRGGYAYHGRVKALADAAREAGLNF